MPENTTITIDTGDIVKWADSMENRGSDFAAEILRKVKSGHERKRREGKLKFAKIRRRKSGNKRFAIVKDSNRAAELLNKSTGDHFKDVFKERK
jgi:hypothetical protein